MTNPPAGPAFAQASWYAPVQPQAPAAPPLAPAGYPPGPAAPPRRPFFRRLPVLVVAGAVAFALLVTGGWFAFRLLTGPRDNPYALADLTRVPDEAWVTDLVSPQNATWTVVGSVVPLDDRAVAVLMNLDTGYYSAQVGSNAQWYEGYDAQYQDGYSAGDKFQQAYQRWVQASWDSGIQMPVESTYWPGSLGPSMDAARNDPTKLGWFDGFSDGRQGTHSSRKQKPDVPTYGQVEVVDSETGAIAWTRPLSDLGFDAKNQNSELALTAKGDIVLVAQSATGQAGAAAELKVTVLAKGTGETTVSFTVPGTTVAHESELSGHLRPSDVLVVADVDADKHEYSLAGYSVTSASDQPLWEERFNDIGGGEVPYLSDGFVTYPHADGSVEVFDAATGKVPAWYQDLDGQVGYRSLGDRILRSEYVESGGYTNLTMLDSSGRKLWQHDADSYQVLETGQAPLVVEYQGGEESLDSLNVLDPGTGKPLWKSSWDARFTSLRTMPGLIVTSGDNRVTLLDAATGEKRTSFRGWAGGVGNHVVYTTDDKGVSAWSSDGVKLWDKRLRENESLADVPGRLLLLDTERRQLIRWK